MTIGWTWPLLTSVLRLVFISTLTLVNFAALYKVVSSRKYKAGKRQERLFLITIIAVSLVYLTVVWAPFTFTALRHDLNDLQQMQEERPGGLDGSRLIVPETLRTFESDTLLNTPEKLKEDEFTVEYIDLVPNLDIYKDSGDKENEFTLEYVDLVADEDRPMIEKKNDFTIEYLDLLKNDKMEDEFIVEYIDLETGEKVEKLPTPMARMARSASERKDLEAEWTIYFQSQPDFQPDISLSPVGGRSRFDFQGEGGVRGHSISWNSDVQDFVTSSCAYSLAFTAVFRLVFMKRFNLFPEGSWVMGVWSGLVVGVPGAVTLLVRKLARTNTHFAPHQPEYTSAGYFLYNIICDVHISEEYVVSVFLEWAALFTLLMVILALVFTIAVKSKRGQVPDSYGILQDGNSSGNVEAWARDVILTIGALWSWPLKPVLVLVLYCLYGSHWTNVVCWMAHVVVAIPVVFIPLAIFLSRCQQEKPNSMDIYVIDEETSQKDTKDVPEGHHVGIPNQYGNAEKVQNTDMSNNIEDYSSGAYEFPGAQSDEERGQARENLKFYLGKDLFKYGLKPTDKPEDKQIILDNEWGETSISEA